MHRVFCGCNLTGRHDLEIHDKDKVHHIRNVLRLKKSDTLVVCDAEGFEYLSIIEAVSSKCVALKLQPIIPENVENIFKLTVACAIPKKSKFEDIVDKLTQLGVDRIIPLKTQRVIVKVNKNNEISKYTRWEKIALNASEQSQRNILPVIDNVKNMEEVISESCGYDLKLIPTLEKDTLPIKQVLFNSKPKNVLVLIGPEGDFSPDEVNSAKQLGCIPVSLGRLVLRVETAAVAAAAILKYTYS